MPRSRSHTHRDYYQSPETSEIMTAEERDYGDGGKRLVEKNLSNHGVAKFINNETESEIENPDEAHLMKQLGGPGESENASQ